MTKNELIHKLDEKNIHRKLYNLDGSLELCFKGVYEGYCVIEEKGIWKIIYNSRGKISYSMDCDSEDVAYDELYKEFAFQHNWQ